ncbi:hypothetical protein G7Y89_g2535 [Cudoniella acicularis]|uniref:Uncharacterized protein n=1 Tax=Cudoniella acicularis TaxID=354080 RepID=A0A8H4W6V7_9HELO|nr:hypothetical protein G7Y89_g2535 [Cudoniella acicularis]
MGESDADGAKLLCLVLSWLGKVHRFQKGGTSRPFPSLHVFIDDRHETYTLLDYKHSTLPAVIRSLTAVSYELASATKPFQQGIAIDFYMPKFPRAFGRRKSTANALEDDPDAPVTEHTFKVFERPGTENKSKSFDGGSKFTKVINGPAGRPNTSHVEEENMFEHLGKNRGSGASNTNTISTTDNSSRLSAASTAPSSTDISGREEWRSPHDKPFNDIPLPPVPKSTSSFSLKNAGRTLSWGRHKNNSPTPPKEASSPTIEEEPSGRARAVTASSYASTATPPKLDERDLGLSLGGDFSDMFTGFGNRKSVILEANESRGFSRSPDILPTGPASRSYTSNRFNHPSPLSIDKTAEVDISPSPYSWTSGHSNDGLMSNSSPPPVPLHGSSPVPRQLRVGASVDTGLRRASGYSGKRQSTIEYGETIDEDARLLRESISASRKLNEPSYANSRAQDSWMTPSASYQTEAPPVSSWRGGSVETTPRARKAVASPRNDEDLFDSQIFASANLAQRFQEKSQSPPTNNAPQNKVMTPAQFERYRQDQERLRTFGGQPKDEEDPEDEEETYDDDEDEAEKNKQLAKQRRKQEAHMAVYRQQMMKVTGETPSAGGSSRASIFATQSSPNLAIPQLAAGGKSDSTEEEDEEVPLAILQAHGFPNKNKPPMRSVGSNPNLRAAVAPSVAGGVVDPRLPVFARNLPEDPYFGAGLVNPMHRESLSFGGGSGSVHGGSSRGLPPGGLVGVIATEERSRAMRRGSPNQQGDFGPPPPTTFSTMTMPPRSNADSMVNGMVPGPMPQMPMGPMGPMPQMGGMGPMMLTPGDQAQIQMSQQMSQFMQMQMQFMQMMTTGGQGQPQPNGHLSQQSLSIPRPSSPHLRPSSAQHQRAMTMMEPNAAPWMQQPMYAPSIHAQGAGYAPSIAPSERSNIGLPGRYRPVSHIPAIDAKSRTSTMSGALGGWENKNSPTIRAVKKSGNISDDDDDEGWEEMAKKREKKKSKWRTKKDSSSGLKEMLGYTQ